MVLAERIRRSPAPAEFLEPDGTISIATVAAKAAELAEQFRGLIGPWMVHSGRPSDVVCALLTAEALNSSVLVCHTNLPAAQVESVQRELGIVAVMRPGFSVERLGQAKQGIAGEGCEILLMTSGTTGRPKVARHSPANLLGRIRESAGGPACRWLLTYPPTSFAGLQVVLTAAVTGSVLLCAGHSHVLSLVKLAAEGGATHISGTPTFWRALLMATDSSLPALRQITLGGEVVDQPTLARLRQRFPRARMAHIYATTELGALFSVHDGLAGFPAAWLAEGVDGVELSVREGLLWVRSPRRMHRYASRHEARMTEDGWFCTGDLVDESDGRIYFKGRTDQVLNIGGAKILPTEIESVILEVEGVADALVSAKSNPITGLVLMAEIVAEPGHAEEVLARVGRHCRASLPSFQVPRIIRLASGDIRSFSGKKTLRGQV